jgi:hypothetical protein
MGDEEIGGAAGVSRRTFTRTDCPEANELKAESKCQKTV